MSDALSIIDTGDRKVFKVEVREVHSGDNLVVLADLGVDDLFKRVRVRLDGVDTPDAFRSGVDTEAGQIRDMVRKLVTNKPCSVEIKSTGKGGWKVVLLVFEQASQTPINVNQMLIEKGYVFKRQPRTSEVA